MIHHTNIEITSFRCFELGTGLSQSVHCIVSELGVKSRRKRFSVSADSSDRLWGPCSRMLKEDHRLCIREKSGRRVKLITYPRYCRVWKGMYMG